jgi:hypothetical protein
MPAIVTRCVDCGLGTRVAGERYMVKSAVREEAWRGRRKPWQILARGQMVLCIGCPEKRLGRTLCAEDFVASAGVNDPDKDDISDRMRDRLGAMESQPLESHSPNLGREMKRKRGRPKGSKDKRKYPRVWAFKQDVDGRTVWIFNEGGVVTQLNSEEEVCARMREIRRARAVAEGRKLGRPKGSKNKLKVLAALK